MITKAICSHTWYGDGDCPQCPTPESKTATDAFDAIYEKWVELNGSRSPSVRIAGKWFWDARESLIPHQFKLLRDEETERNAENKRLRSEWIEANDAVKERDEEIARLNERVIGLKTTLDIDGGVLRDFKVENKRLREALEYYAVNNAGLDYNQEVARLALKDADGK